MLNAAPLSPDRCWGPTSNCVRFQMTYLSLVLEDNHHLGMRPVLYGWQSVCPSSVPTGLKVSDRKRQPFTTSMKPGHSCPTQKVLGRVKAWAQHFSEVADSWLLGYI